MPLYDFECVGCGKRHEMVFPVDKCPESVRCPVCEEPAVKIIAVGHGGAFCDSGVDVPWLASARKVLQPDHERPIETRQEYNRYLKERNIIAAG
ncbi:MAG: zinc ribbon domain-containing protein [Deltaproteobacteria bacterium]|nr:zinc ribbon domain-containing protein [Deltaproteobacteria bacterium]